MLRRSVFALAAFSSLFVQSVPAADYDAARRAAASVVRVVASTPAPRGSFGSGVVLPNGRVATNCHVTRNASSVSVVEDGVRLAVLEVIGDSEADICVLRVAGLHAQSARLPASRNLQVGDEVVAAGFGGGFAKTVSVGEVTALFPYRGGYVIRTTAAFRPGVSGGGLFDRDGNLVGLITFFRRGADDFAFFAVPVEWVDALQLSRDGAHREAKPFWMLAHAEQPRFLQVVTFEADAKWREMAAAARLWTEEEPGEAQAWEALGRALINQGERAEGAAAMERAQRAVSSLTRAALR